MPKMRRRVDISGMTSAPWSDERTFGAYKPDGQKHPQWWNLKIARVCRRTEHEQML